MRLAALMLVTTLGAAGCEGNDTYGDPFPIAVNLTSGPVLAQIREGDAAPRTAVVDILSPITVLDEDRGGEVRRRGATLTLLGAGDVPRAQLGVTLAELHPCPAGEPCRVGPADAPVEISAVIGADALARGAARFDFAGQRMFLFPDIAGNDAARARVCDAVLPSPYFGGGTLSLGGTEIEFTGRRLAVAACLGHDAETDPDDVTDAGADVLLVVSTGIGITILGEAAYARWLAASGTTAPAATPGSVWLPSGRIEGNLATIDRMTLVGRDNTTRGPCRLSYAHRLLSVRSCNSSDDCPCTDDFCSVPGQLELTPATAIDVLVIPDEHPLLQALRAELRPEAAEIDGILGTAALAPASLDVDAPNSRALLRCETGDGCRVRPELFTVQSRSTVERCLALDVVDAGPVDAP